jgi:2',3'-cyclic-nucleotide 2'-phosphodiesterase
LYYRILFCGDVVGRPGRSIIQQGLPSLIETYRPAFTVVNGENSASGIGITPDNAEEIFKSGADAITLGNHAFGKREIYSYMDSGKPIVRPSNMPKGVPGRGCVIVEKSGLRLAVMNICGRIYMDTYGDPFYEADLLLSGLDTPHRLLDFHAEATSEKIAMGYHCAGRATAVVGTGGGRHPHARHDRG